MDEMILQSTVLGQLQGVISLGGKGSFQQPLYLCCPPQQGNMGCWGPCPQPCPTHCSMAGGVQGLGAGTAEGAEAVSRTAEGDGTAGLQSLSSTGFPDSLLP